MTDETIAAISTPMGTGGIGIVRISGEKALEIAAKIFEPSGENADVLCFSSHTVHYGKIKDSDGNVIDEALLTYMKAPRSYTGEDVVELSCHGSIMSVKYLLRAALSAGARLAGRGEFTKRAFLNGKLDLAQAEAVTDIITSKSERALACAVNQLEGKLSENISGVREKLVEVMAYIEAETDFPEDDVSGLSEDEVKEKLSSSFAEIKKLIKSMDSGKVIRDGVETAIIGRPNVGKSSLLNALIGENRAIVTDIPGTTRDTIEEYLELDGVTLKLADTAGIRNTSDTVEKIGVDRAFDSIEKAQLVLFVADLSEMPQEDDRELINKIGGKTAVMVLNKSDTEKDGAEAAYRALADLPCVKISAAEGSGIETLTELIKELFGCGNIESDNLPFLYNLRHYESLVRAEGALKNALSALADGISADMLFIDVFDALEALGEIVGMNVSEEVVDKIFEKFCVGK